MTNFDFTSMDQIKDTESILIDRLARRLRLPAWFRWRMMRTTSRDNARTPMQWDATGQAGFTNGSPWLGVNRNHDRINYADQLSDPDSILHFYRKMIALRATSEVLLDGTFRLLHASRHISVYERVLDQAHWIILLNFSTRGRSAARFVPNGAQLVLSSAGSQTFSGRLQPYEAVILRREAKS